MAQPLGCLAGAGYDARAYEAVAARLGQELAPKSHDLATPGAHPVALIGH